MAANSNIEWTEHTWNPVTGCVKVSQGCKHCYAEVMARRFHMAVKRLGLNLPSTPLAVHKFKRPARLGDQLALF